MTARRSTFTAWDAALSVQVNCAEAIISERSGPEGESTEVKDEGLKDF